MEASLRAKNVETTACYFFTQQRCECQTFSQGVYEHSTVTVLAPESNKEYFAFALYIYWLVTRDRWWLSSTESFSPILERVSPH